ncbi:MAG: hypothetical protein Q4F95_05185 [Oscillospiraceae bacterium]|nr:hypothetical protein [Oscillospiraceae bacterium]
MKKEDLFECIGGIDDDLITRSESKRVISVKKLCAAAACFAVLVSGCVFAGKFLSGSSGSVVMNPDSSVSGILESSQISENPDKVSSEGSVTVPEIKLPENDGTASMDMIGLIVYKGKVYTQTQYYRGEDAERINSLVGDYLGHAKGGIDEWSDQDDYAEELASTNQGNVYSVRGYETDFRICIKDTYQDEDGVTAQTVEFFENLNGITLTLGKDLFEGRLKISQKLNCLKYLTHDDWNNSEENYIDLSNVSPEKIQEFISEVDNAEFEYVWESDKDFYNKEKQAHLFITLDDQTVVELRLLEGGYVGYQHLGWYFVKIPGETFDEVFNVCQ